MPALGLTAVHWNSVQRLQTHPFDMSGPANILAGVSEESLRALIEKNADGMVVIDVDGLLRFVNPAAERLFGRRDRQLLGQPFGFPVVNGQTTQVELMQPAGGVVLAEMLVVETTWEGKPAHLASLRNVTARYQAEQEVRRLNAELESRVNQRTMELREKTAQLEAASRAKDQFLAVLSHELRTPLTPVLLAVTSLQQDPQLAESLRGDMQMIHRNVELEAKLIDDLLDLTRITRGKLHLDLHLIDLHDCLNHVMKICEAEVAAKPLRLNVQLKARHSKVMGDSARLQQVFWNLLKNAIKFTPENGTITISSEDDGNVQIRVEVVDTGVGISSEVLPKLFNAFEQGNTAVTRQFGGLGLGLVIAKAVVEAHKGTLKAESDGKNRGAKLTVELPLTISQEKPAQICAPPGKPEDLSRQKVHILLVEDHAETLQLMTRLLKKMGHEISSASSVEGALRVIENSSIDLLVSDLDLPDGTGHDVIKALRNRGSSAPGIALSGFGMEADVQKSREAGFAEHLIKPVELAKLRSTIHRVAEGKSVQ